MSEEQVMQVLRQFLSDATEPACAVVESTASKPDKVITDVIWLVGLIREYGDPNRWCEYLVDTERVKVVTFPHYLFRYVICVVVDERGHYTAYVYRFPTQALFTLAKALEKGLAQVR